MLNRSSGPEYALHPHVGNGASAPAPAPAEAEDEISLREVLEVLRKGKWIVLGCFGAVMLLVAIYTFVQAPAYQATSLLYVNKEQSAPQLGELMGLEGGRNDVANEVEILKSRTIARGVAGRLMEQRYVPGTNEPLTVLLNEDEAENGPLTEVDVAQRLRHGYVQVQPVSRETDLINVTARSTLPREAALIADLYAEEYVQYNRAQSRRRMSASREFLDDMTGQFRRQLQISEDTLTTFLNEERVVAPEEEVKQLLEQVKDLRQRQYEAQLERTAARTQLRALRQRVAELAPRLAERIASDADVAIEGLKQELGRNVAALEAKYARNPALRADPAQDPEAARLEQEIASLQGEINERAESLAAEALQSNGVGMGTSATGAGVTQGVLGRFGELQEQITRYETQVEAQEARLEIIQENLAQYNAQLEGIPNKEIVLNRLERTLETQREIYLSLIEKLQEARVAEESELGYVSIVDEAVVPEQPVSPKVPLNLALGAILGLVLGVGGAFAKNAFDTKVRAPEDLRKHGYSVVGVVPDMSRAIKEDFDGRERVTVEGRTYSTRLVALLNPLSPTAEHYRRLRTNIQFSRPDGRLQTIMVTSSGPGEGKSVTSMNLALTMAQMGRKTAYVDADLRRPTGHKMMGTAREPGLTDLLFESYPAGLDRFASGVDHLHVIPAGRSVPNPAEVLGSQKMRDFLERLEAEFDVVVVDTPPVLAVTDALLISARCDATVLVSSMGETHWQALQRSKEALDEAGAHVAGVVLNRFDAKAAYGSYGYGYGYGYGIYYGEEEAAA